MPQVPYQKFPTVEPTSPGEQISVNTPPAAFGENIGAALDHLGTTTEHVGDELWTRAIALQDLRNETDARQATNNFMVEQGLSQAKYDALEGKEKVDALPGHLEDTKALAQKYRGTLTAPNAQRMFDQEAQSFVSRNIIQSATQAGQANKTYASETSNASAKLSGDQVRQHPDDQGAFDQALHAHQEAAALDSHIKGIPEGSPAAVLAQKQAVSSVNRARIAGVNDHDPDRAAKMLEDAQDKGVLTDTDYAVLENTIKAQSRSISSTNIANETMVWGKGNPELNIPPKTTEEMVEHAKDLAKQRHPDDPMVSQHAVVTLHGMDNVSKWETQRQSVADVNTVQTAIRDNNIQNVQQLKAMPEVQAAIARQGPKYENSLPGQINRINDAKQATTKVENFERLNGLYNNDRLGFMNTDLTKEGLSFTDLKYWSGKQADAAKNMQADPRVAQAVKLLKGSMGAQLEDLHIYKRTEQYKDDYDRFTGALSAALDTWRDDHSKPASANDIVNEIAPHLLQLHAAGGFLGMHNAVFGSDDPFYKQDVSTKEAQNWIKTKKDEVVAQGGSEPTDKQMEQAWTRYQYVKLYGKKEKPGE